MNYTELKEAIKKYIRELQEEIDENGDYDYEDAWLEIIYNQGKFDENKIQLKRVYENDSYDGITKEWVFEHKNGEESIYVMFTGFYSSYGESEVDHDFNEVKPYTYTETRYK